MRKLPFQEEIEKRLPEKLVGYGNGLEHHTNQLKDACKNIIKEAIDYKPSLEEQYIIMASNPGTIPFFIYEGKKKTKGWF